MKYYLTRTNNNTHPVQSLTSPFDSFFRPFFDLRPVSNLMKTDICEVGENYQLQIDIPGFEKDQIALKFEDSYLTVSAKAEEKEQQGNYITRERKSNVSRSYFIGEVDQEAIKAKYDKGVLTVTFPKEKEKLAASTITID